MIYDLNEERKAYLQARGKVILNACPGSGKTTTIAKKIIALELSKEIDSYSGIACLSFTNSAKDEINESYSRLSGKILRFPNHVSTIDSFINKFITLPFYNILNRDFSRPKILDHTNILNDMWMTEYRGSDGKLREGLKRPLNNPEYKAKNNRSIFYTYPPSSIRIEPNGSFTVEGKTPSNSTVDIDKFNNYCKLIKQTQFKKGLISTGDSAFIALHILRTNPKICQWLAIRFPFIIIDEAQDNSLIQHAIFEELSKQGLKNIELIGDPYQSLYEWRDANPNEFLKKYNEDDSWNSFDLTDNRRSPQNIIDVFSILRKADDPKINCVDSPTQNDTIIIYKYSENNLQSIIKHYEEICSKNNFKKNNIVVRGNSLKNKLLGNTTEEKPWGIELPKEIIIAKNRFSGNDIKNSINEMRTISIKLLNPESDYHQLKEIERNSKEDHLFNSLLFQILNELPSFELTVADWTSQTQIFMKEKLGLNYDVDFNLRNRKSKFFNKEITLNESINIHFKKSYTESNIPITTIHQVKGKTLDSVLIFFNERSHVNNILFEDISNLDNSFPNEKKRLIYVAMSRPKKVLAMAFPNTVTDENIIGKFGKNIRLVTEDELNE
ncbi:ATP-dependent helicase [Flavobacterium degerlachei]|jgi:superfamily I DNA/RNA helicase|uniref:DNA 3'-5' helicase n=1 Tax=Flavobacterium degerlachei TaxID=229203 RepID=A0A1H2UK33_9FLAO|nr:ATP-dependent helicase [Flavobacterium degerlachei]SDW55949.1 Superfamily I DNA or RNA helicase [Flavobacterium degerlachei]